MGALRDALVWKWVGVQQKGERLLKKQALGISQEFSGYLDVSFFSGILSNVLDCERDVAVAISMGKCMKFTDSSNQWSLSEDSDGSNCFAVISFKFNCSILFISIYYIYCISIMEGRLGDSDNFSGPT